MQTGNGKGVFAGIAIGKVFVFKKQELVIVRGTANTVEEEVARYKAAKELSAKQLKALFDKTAAEVGQEEAMIIDVQLLMLDDLDYEEEVMRKITEENENAAYAVTATGEEFADFFASMDDPYMKARAVDVGDVSKRIAMNIQGINPDGIKMEEPMIIVAEDLTPSETLQLDKNMILAFVTQKGSSNSHTAILARTMNIPSLVGADIEITPELNGKLMIVDGNSGKYYIDPDDITLDEKERRRKAQLQQKELLNQLKGKENVTIDGRKINIYANIGNPKDVELVINNDAGGIGLFRSEFLYLGRDSAPTEEEQFASYKYVAEKMNGKKVIIRTLDIGADKKADYFGFEQEENPALGYRAIRICLDQVDLFKTQLRAIYRASAFGQISIMFPMIISVSEVRRIKEICEEVKEELIKEGYEIAPHVELGIMIETPAAVMVSEELAKEVEFFSVGTNDLTQYTLAIDRQNAKLDKIYDAHHPAILRMLKMIVDNAHKAGAWAGICGELGSDTTLTETFLKMGFDELSVSPTFVLSVRKAVRDTDLSKKEAVVE
ncbi:phosphoenolpyruvate--protein phosphotransferase [Anaeromassilibacillus sp. An172]|uniref:phosphoenolpyruvate--protein phosphotransferase n=1 Tax=Anaeromassilibacillus sp. An172 TaxID=1965570 RepID=UPI000B3ACDD2|nr:phosphoenolpyruvate--protein phosphotransferase [Anaeromassilibacillus sp. An172]MEE0761662.1 phosphoenolpyruvate--protein phosphotransferase [Acutalibacteraceae bacterium]OUP78056.1 phosphoenolpyruvate--protein phosphotransferase [Anaeromassilibacillus sp. An172]